MRGRLGSFFRGIFSVEPLRPSRSRIKPAGGELKSKEEFFKFPSAPCRRRSDVERSRRSKTTIRDRDLQAAKMTGIRKKNFFLFPLSTAPSSIADRFDNKFVTVAKLSLQCFEVQPTFPFGFPFTHNLPLFFLQRRDKTDPQPTHTSRSARKRSPRKLDQ
ncbi:hypothetical protein Tsp_05309 [Trichinella spiralis]|uniref:hypothetical protein n=1 Tax=Trichinella spiralis TaxID=6334 RepID=UPI0001EFEE89|nr:hypothetical protein Tsp_05309 [Trichinella spiralis]